VVQLTKKGEVLGQLLKDSACKRYRRLEDSLEAMDEYKLKQSIHQKTVRESMSKGSAATLAACGPAT
jgi:hypothetical protein